MHRSPHPPGDFVFPVVFFSARNLGQLRQALGNRRVEFSLQQRNYELPHAIASERFVSVRRVLAPALPNFVQILLEFAPPHRKQGRTISPLTSPSSSSTKMRG